MTDAPRVFLSYSHDSAEHADRVLALADALRGLGGDVTFDRYVHPAPAGGWPRWMDRHLDDARFVLMVCTETYRRRVVDREEPDKGLGVRWEAGLTLKSLRHDGTQYSLRFSEKGGMAREIPVRHDLQKMLLDYIQAAGITVGPLFRPAFRRTKKLTAKAMSGIGICRMMKRRLKAAGLPGQFSPHSFRVATVTNLLEQNVPLRGRAAPGRACRPGDHAALRPAEEEGHPEHRRADFDLTDGMTLSRGGSCFPTEWLRS